MAIYGRDFYGLTKYGSAEYVDVSVQPFVASPEGYNAIRLSWTYPGGAWDGLRLMRSRHGYAVSEHDGLTLLDTDRPENGFVDDGLAGGVWYYYTIFLLREGKWYKAGQASGLSLKDMGSFQVLWDRVPRYFRWIPKQQFDVSDSYYADATIFDPETSGDRENQHLVRFLEILAWGVDLIRNHQQTLLLANDPANVHISGLDRLAQQMGTRLEYAVPAKLIRNKVQHTATVSRKRGTVEMLSELASLDTGWDIEVTLGRNRMLNPDQAEFASPQYEDWNAGSMYFPGERAIYAERVVENLVQAMGTDQAPPMDPVDTNTWWVVVTDDSDSALVDPATGGVSTWKAFRDDEVPADTSLAVGITSPVDSTTASNALRVANNGAVAHDIDLWGSASLAGSGPLPEPEQVVQHGIPMPWAPRWHEEREYRAGQYTVADGVLYRATRIHTDMYPTEAPGFWEKVGVDERPYLGLSFWAHGPFSGTVGSGGVPVIPGVSFFDVHGNLIRDMLDGEDSGQPLLYDTFNNNPDYAFTDRTPEFTYAGEQWTTPVGTWDIVQESGNVAWSPSEQAVAVMPAPTGVTQYRVGVTFYSDVTPGRVQGLVLRYVDADNYFRVTRTGVQRKVAGTVTAVSTFTEPINDGDRLVVEVDDTTEAWTVYVNDVEVASGTGLVTATAPYLHGMMVE